ncbi:LacI family DNA-binding transcriptional regulator [soil metagenome]
MTDRPPMPRPRRPTIRDVAERAGVSFKTVSRVVNAESGVRPEVASVVEQAINDLGYQRDDRARRLRQGATTSGVIGFVLVDVSNPFFSSILRGIEEVARRHDSLVLAGSTDADLDREAQLVGAFAARRVDGLIVIASEQPSAPLRNELLHGTPVGFVDLEPKWPEFDLVRSDHEGGASLATRHLIEHGHRDIAFVGDAPSTFSAALRRNGFLHEMARAGQPVPADRVLNGSHEPEEWSDIIAEYLDGPGRPTALFTAQNFITVGAAQALHRLGLHRRIAQIGFDDVTLAAEIEPALSVVPQDPLMLGRRAATRLFQRIAGTAGPAERQILPTAVVARGSGEIRGPG